MVKRHRRAALALAALWALCDASVHAAGPATEAVLGYLVVPDVENALAHAEVFGRTFQPDAPAGALRGMLGTTLGDPTLANLKGGAPVVFLVFRGGAADGSPSYAWFLTVTDAKPVEAAFATRGWKARTADGLLVAAPTAEALTAAESERSRYPTIAAAGARGDARILVRTDLLTQTYGPLLHMGLEAGLAQAAARPQASPAPGGSAMPAQPSPEALRLLKIEARAFLGALEDSTTLRWDLSLEGDAVRSEMELTPQAGTGLAELTSMPAPGTNPTCALVAAGGALTAVYSVDPRILSGFVNRLLDAAAKDPDAAVLFTPDAQSLIRDALSWSTGQMTMTLRGAPGGGLVSEAAVGVRDETKVLDTLEKSASLLAGGTWAQMYASMGIQTSSQVKRDVRRHGGVTVHRMSFALQSKNAPPEQATFLKAFLKDTDLALTRGYYLASQEAAGLDRMIDSVASGGTGGASVELRAASDFGPGRHVYVDYDLLALTGSALSALTPKPGEKVPVIPTSGEPMTFALSLSDGRFLALARIPARPFVQLGQAMVKAHPLTPPAH